MPLSLTMTLLKYPISPWLTPDAGEKPDHPGVLHGRGALAPHNPSLISLHTTLGTDWKNGIFYVSVIVLIVPFKEKRDNFLIDTLTYKSCKCFVFWKHLFCWTNDSDLVQNCCFPEKTPSQTTDHFLLFFLSKPGLKHDWYGLFFSSF